MTLLLKFLAFYPILCIVSECQLIDNRKMSLGTYNEETKKYEKVNKQVLLGGDDHDYKNHKKVLLGGDDHDYKNHKKVLLGGDDHDYKNHKKVLLGGDDHDYKNHKKVLLGGDDHDYKNHKKVLLGGDDHDYKNHKKVLLGGDDHDYKNHKKALLGGDDHDYKNHKKNSPHDYISLKKGNKLFTRKTEVYLPLFNKFIKTHNKGYKNHSEFKKRFRIFRSNMRKAKTMQMNEKGTAEYGISKFADLTAQEFRQLLGLRPDLKPLRTNMKSAQIPNVVAPKEFDWRIKGVVTPVKNQGMCGSCWAFSVTGNVEGQWAIKHTNLLSLSEQELVDCDSTDQGCNGGLPENAYKAIEDLGGLETETSYAYEGKDDKCQLETQKIVVKVNGSVEIPQDEEEMKKWLYANGPISIGINANALQFYVGGVSHPFKFLCNPDSLDHGMLIVGYGVHTYPLFNKTLPYWVVKNSWGEKWGEQGYYRVYRGDGTCGVNKMATSATVP